MTKGHLCSLKMEEIHQFDEVTLADRAEIDVLGFVVKFDDDRENFNVL